jgi:serine phosphatase RsbU (regulator of sigma subunit)/CHASE1-domain containing sensor protein
VAGRGRAGRGAPRAPGPSARPAAPAPLRLWPRAAAVVLVLLVGGAGALAVADDARRDATQREELLADQTGNLAMATVQQLVAAISGVSGLSDPSGVVDRQAFEAYALGAVEASPLESLAFAPVVAGPDRASFEASVGRPITDRPGGAPEPVRDGYVPVAWVRPVDPEIEVLVGFDLATDEVRRAAMEESRDRGAAVISRTVASQPSGRPAVFIAHPVYRAGTPLDATVAERRAAVVGYVTTGVLGEHVLAAIAAQVDDSLGIRIEDAGSGDEATDEAIGPLVAGSPAPDGGVTVERSAGGRDWLVTVDDRRGAPAAAAWWVLAVTLALASTLGVLAWRADRHQRQVARHVALVDRLADLGRALAGTASVDAVTRVVRTSVPPALAASEARLTVPAPPGDAGDRGRRGGAGTGDAGPRPRRGEDDDRAGRASRAVVRRRIPDANGATAGTLEVIWGVAGDVDDLTLAGLATVGEMCGQALGRARVIDQARRDAVTSRLLAGLAEAAATAATANEVARRLVDRAGDVPGATSTHIGLLTDDRRALSVIHQGLGVDDTRVDVRGLDRPWPMLDAFRRNDIVLLGDLDAVRARYPSIVDGMQEASLEALASLPLVGADGVPFGVVTLAWASPQRFDAGQATTLQATADLCASSLERARATDLTQAGSSSLATLATHLSAASSFDDVGAAIVAHATRALSADFALVGVVEGQHLRLLAPEAPSLGPLAPYLETDLSGDFPALEAVRELRLVTFPSLDDIAAADPRVADDLGALGLRAGACAPLIDAAGAASGVFVVLWVTSPTFDEALSARIRAVADLCAQSIERSRLFDAEHRVRRDLERTVLPPPPRMDGLEVITRYEAATAAVGMGGDWYDAIALDDRRVCLVVGDVSGHGAGAVATMTQIRTVVHTLVVGGMTLPDVLLHTSAMLQRDGLGYATVLLAVVDLARGAIDYVTAGHPPALVRQPGGAVHALTGGRHSVLGIDLAAKPVGYVPFPVGASLVVYTDGLIERRDTEIATSVDQLIVCVRDAGELAADALADLLLAARPSVGAAQDDVALVVARRTA